MLNMFYLLANAQGIRLVVNIGTSASAPTSLENTTLAPTPSPTSAIEAPTPMLKVGHSMGTAATLLVEKHIALLASTKRARDEGQQSSQGEISLKIDLCL